MIKEVVKVLDRESLWKGGMIKKLLLKEKLFKHKTRKRKQF